MVSSITIQYCQFFETNLNGTLTGTTTPGQSGPWRNCNEGVLDVPLHSSTRVSLLNGNLLSFLLRCDTRPYERGTQ